MPTLKNIFDQIHTNHKTFYHFMGTGKHQIIQCPHFNPGPLLQIKLKRIPRMDM